MSQTTTAGADAYSRPPAQFTTDARIELRASALGRCRRALWYAATEHPVTNPPAPDSLTVMEAGNALEPVVVRAMQRAGWTVTPADRHAPEAVSVEVSPLLTVTGHPDATGCPPPEDGAAAAVEQFLFGDGGAAPDGSELVIEVKTRGPAAFKRWRTLGAERSHPDSVAQAACYSLGLFGGRRAVVIATLDTGSRQWDFELIPAERVERAWAQACRRLEALAEHYAACGPDPAALPERDFEAADWQCRRCPYFNACRPGGAVEAAEAAEPEPAAAVSDEQAQQALREYEQAQQQLKRLDTEKRAALDTLQAWLEQSGAAKARLDGAERTRSVGLIQSRRYTVNHRRLNALLDPETRAEIVTERVSAYLRVS